MSFTPVNVADTIPLIPPPFSLYADFMWSSFVDTLDFAVSMREVALSFIFVKSVDHFDFISELLRMNPDLISVQFIRCIIFPFRHFCCDGGFHILPTLGNFCLISDVFSENFDLISESFPPDKLSTNVNPAE